MFIIFIWCEPTRMIVSTSLKKHFGKSACCHNHNAVWVEIPFSYQCLLFWGPGDEWIEWTVNWTVAQLHTCTPSLKTHQTHNSNKQNIYISKYLKLLLWEKVGGETQSHLRQHCSSNKYSSGSWLVLVSKEIIFIITIITMTTITITISIIIIIALASSQ